MQQPTFQRKPSIVAMIPCRGDMARHNLPIPPGAVEIAPAQTARAGGHTAHHGLTKSEAPGNPSVRWKAGHRGDQSARGLGAQGARKRRDVGRLAFFVRSRKDSAKGRSRKRSRARAPGPGWQLHPRQVTVFHRRAKPRISEFRKSSFLKAGRDGVRHRLILARDIELRPLRCPARFALPSPTACSAENRRAPPGRLRQTRTHRPDARAQGARRHCRDRHAAHQAVRRRRHHHGPGALPGGRRARRHQDRRRRPVRSRHGVRRRGRVDDGAVLGLAATDQVAGRRAAAFGATVVVDTITQSGRAELLPADAAFPDSFGYVAVHSPTDVRLAGDQSTGHIDGPATPSTTDLRRPTRPICSTCRRKYADVVSTSSLLGALSGVPARS